MKPVCIPLSQVPELKNQVVLLIEESFGYEKEQSFEVDFLPLMHKSNWDNVFLTIDSSKRVMSCGGFREVSLLVNNKEVACAFIGGIATKMDYRGQGLGGEMLNFLVSKLRAKDAILLWSDKVSFYQKFGFHEFGSVYENCGKDWCSENATYRLNELTPSQQEHIISHYSNFHNRFSISPIRTNKDWQIIFKMSSVRCSLFPWGYLFIGKGMDLPGIIHEVACHPEFQDHLRELITPYSYWLQASFLKADQTRYAGLVRYPSPSSCNLDQVFIPGIDSI